MAEPRYRPRDFCIPPELFGKAPLRQTYWQPVPVPNADQLPLEVRDQREREQRILMAAAQMQHANALAIRQLMKAKNLTLAEYAKLTGRDSGKRIGAYLRGEVVMRFDDLAWAEDILGDVRGLVQQYETVFKRQDQALSLGIDMRMGTPWPEPRATAAAESHTFQQRSRPPR